MVIPRIMVGRILVLSLGITYVYGQTITFAGAAGCADLRPDAPRNLRVEPGDGQVTLYWEPPANGACVSQYLVSAVSSGSFRSSAGSAAPKRVKELSTVVYGLQNQVSYTFTIQAVNDKFGDGGMASVVGTPSNKCKDELPGPVVNLRANSLGDNFVEVCWDGVSNKACVDEYRVASVPEDQAQFRNNMERTISKGGCLKVNNLENHKPYVFYVVAYSTKFGEGQVTQIKATPGQRRTGGNQMLNQVVNQVVTPTGQGPARSFIENAQQAIQGTIETTSRNLVNGMLEPFGAFLP